MLITMTKETNKGSKISKEIRSHFTLMGWTYADAAAMLGCKPQTVANRICGKKFGPNAARKWSETFGFDEVFLLSGEGELKNKVKIHLNQ